MEIDRQKSQALSQVVRQHPGMSLAAISPAIVVFGVVWFLTNFWLAFILAVVAGGVGYYLLTRKS
ncbi:MULTISPECIES: hypothetical protein [unclassified Gordonia (in: high G+C Gram-positive bacteria)]|nr:hypothetical protein [Gordonia sp. ABSL49_1]MCH5644608.1 hypothetical protein [Gordonia sp. ABSL49_1]